MIIKGFHADRLHKDAGNPREVAFARQWDAENEGHRSGFHAKRVGNLIPDCTARDAVVAATIVQWLGTAVGMDFLQRVITSSPQVKRRLLPDTERKALEKLVETNEMFMYQLDETMTNKVSTVERGQRIAKLTNALNIAVDGVRYDTLGIDFRKDKPLKVRVESRLKKQEQRRKK